jgi:hypothetical protein
VTVIDYGETSFDGTLDGFKALSSEGLHASFMASLKQGVA